MKIIDYLQIPYKHLGRTKEATDCYGLVKLFYELEFNINLPEFMDYEENWRKTSANYFIELYKKYKFERVGSPHYGDVAFFRTEDKVTHCGVVTDISGGYFLHTTLAGTYQHCYKQGDWWERLFGFYRYKGLHK